MAEKNRQEAIPRGSGSPTIRLRARPFSRRNPLRSSKRSRLGAGAESTGRDKGVLRWSFGTNIEQAAQFCKKLLIGGAAYRRKTRARRGHFCRNRFSRTAIYGIRRTYRRAADVIPIRRSMFERKRRVVGSLAAT
jgi:hypothetical protein